MGDSIWRKVSVNISIVCVCVRVRACVLLFLLISHQVFIPWRQPQREATPVCSEAFAVGQGKREHMSSSSHYDML